MARKPRSALRRISSAPTVGVEQVRDLQWDHPPRREARPLLDHPVVPRAHAHERKLGVVGELLEALAGEAGEERRKTDRRVDAVEIHVGDASADVPGTAAHLVEARRLEAVLADRSAGDGVETDVRQLLTLEDPHLTSVVMLDDAWGTIGEFPGKTAGERVRRLDDVIVDRDDREPPLGSLGLGEPAHRSLLGGRESLSRLQVFERDRHDLRHHVGFRWPPARARLRSSTPVPPARPATTSAASGAPPRSGAARGPSRARASGACTCARRAPPCRPPRPSWAR